MEFLPSLTFTCLTFPPHILQLSFECDKSSLYTYKLSLALNRPHPPLQTIMAPNLVRGILQLPKMLARSIISSSRTSVFILSATQLSPSHTIPARRFRYPTPLASPEVHMLQDQRLVCVKPGIRVYMLSPLTKCYLRSSTNSLPAVRRRTVVALREGNQKSHM